MTTRIVFGGGAEIEVPLSIEQVKAALQTGGQGQWLAELELGQLDRNGNPIRIWVNPDQVAYIMDAESAKQPVEGPPDDDVLPDETSDAQAETSRQPITDLWGNPIRPRRRKR